MKNLNLFTSNLSGKQLISEKSLTRKATNEALANFASAIEAAFNQVIKSEDRRARNVANAAKGKYRTALHVVEACYPFQTSEGVLCTRKLMEESDVRIWVEKKLTAAAARGIVRDSLNNFTKGVGTPEVQVVKIGEAVVKAEPKAKK